jgi:ABC-type multidrug transport system fused ATPase/permease subunit
VEQGNHQELLERHGIYADLWRQQVNLENKSLSRIN